jgi:predicted peroxiredoxin
MTSEQNSLNSLVDLYLTDETKLYQDWYLSIQTKALDPDSTLFSTSDSLEELKQRFATWWQQSVETDRQRLQNFKDKVCKQWVKIRPHEKTHHILVATIFDNLPSSHLPHSLALATILVTHGYLDGLCAGYVE